MALFLPGGRFFKRRVDIKRVVTAIQPYCSSVVSGKKHINGVDLHYELRGRGKHALLFFPGLMGCTRTSFAPQLKSLNKERFTLVNWDPRGYGQSRPPARDFPPDCFDRDAKDAVDLMKALGFDKFSVLAWSAGGTTGLFTVAKNPDVIRQFVVWGAFVSVPQDELKNHEEMSKIPQWPPTVRVPLEAVYGVEPLAKIWGTWKDRLFEFAKRPEGNICMELVPQISCPTLILHGEKDTFTPSNHSQYIHKHIKGSRLHLIPDGKHSIHLTHSEEFNKMVEDFLED